jgi:hypothetical protein
MVPHLITFSLPLQDTTLQMWELIELELTKYGDPINWVVVDADPQTQTVTVDALMHTASESPAPKRFEETDSGCKSDI